MKNAYTYVSRMPSYYTSDDCAQVMIRYKKYMTMFDKDGVLYHYSPENIINVNGYLNDNRRFQFPYHDIPVHVERRGFSTYTYTNQLLNYDEPYFIVSGNAIIECRAILDKDEALVINNILPVKKNIINVDREGLDRLFKKDNDTYILEISGAAAKEDYSFQIATEDDVVSWAQKRLSSDLDKFKYFLGTSYFGHDWLKKNMNDIVKNVNIDTIPELPLNVYDGMVIVKLKDGTISLQVVEEVIFLGPNQYRVVIMDLPLMDKNITMDTLRMLNISNVREPQINRRLNPNISSELIEANRRLVRRLK